MHLGVHATRSKALMCSQASAVVNGSRCGRMDILHIMETTIKSTVSQTVPPHAMNTMSVLGSTPRMANALIGEVARSLPVQMQVIVATSRTGHPSLRLKTRWIWRWALKSMNLRCRIPHPSWKRKMRTTSMRRLVFQIAAGATVAAAGRTGATGVGAMEACAEPAAITVISAGTTTITAIANGTAPAEESMSTSDEL